MVTKSMDSANNYSVDIWLSFGRKGVSRFTRSAVCVILYVITYRTKRTHFIRSIFGTGATLPLCLCCTNTWLGQRCQNWYYSATQPDLGYICRIRGSCPGSWVMISSDLAFTNMDQSPDVLPTNISSSWEKAGDFITETSLAWQVVQCC